MVARSLAAEAAIASPPGGGGRSELIPGSRDVETDVNTHEFYHRTGPTENPAGQAGITSARRYSYVLVILIVIYVESQNMIGEYAAHPWGNTPCCSPTSSRSVAPSPARRSTRPVASASSPSIRASRNSTAASGPRCLTYAASSAIC